MQFDMPLFVHLPSLGVIDQLKYVGGAAGPDYDGDIAGVALQDAPAHRAIAQPMAARLNAAAAATAPTLAHSSMHATARTPDGAQQYMDAGLPKELAIAKARLDALSDKRKRKDKKSDKKKAKKHKHRR